MPSPALLQATAENAIEWLVANRRWFDPANVDLPGRRDKPVVELALLLRALRDSGSTYPGLDELVALVREVAARPERRHMPRPTRRQLVAGAFLFATAHREPAENPAEHQRLQRLVDIRLLDTLEQPVHRAMEDRLALEWAGLRHSLPSWQALARGSILGAMPNPALLDEAAAYQLTHVVMYLTAFGSHTSTGRVEIDDGHRQLFSTLLVRFVAYRHWDLVGELLFSWSLLELGPSPVCEGAWLALLREMEPSGAIAQPRRDAEPERGASFLDRYHPTLVTAITADSWRTSRAPLAPRPGGGARAVERSVLREMADIEAAWLEPMLEAPRETDPQVVCSALVGLWICGTLSAEARQRLPQATILALQAARAVGDWTRIPAGLAIVASGLFARSHPVPEGLAVFVEAAAAALRSSPPADLTLCEKRVLLHGLGRATQPHRAPLRSVVEVAERTALDPTADNVERLLLLSESSAAYGTHSVDFAVTDGWVPELLRALAAERAQSHDLVRASRLLRASVHIDPSPAGRADLVELLIAQQRSAGGYGLFGNAAPAGPEKDGSAVERNLMLRLSVDCLWTIAEAATPWRLTATIAGMTR